MEFVGTFKVNILSLWAWVHQGMFMKNTLHLNFSHCVKMLFFLRLMFFFTFATSSAFAQSQVVELFIGPQCAANDVAIDISKQLYAEQGKRGVLPLVCDLENQDCKVRKNSYTHRRVLQRYGTPSCVMNGRYDVLADNEQVMRSGLAMVQSTMSLRPIGLEHQSDGIIVTFPDMIDDEIYVPWLAVYNSDTRQIDVFKRLESIRGDRAVCVKIANVLSKEQSYAVFLHKSDGEIVASGAMFR